MGEMGLGVQDLKTLSLTHIQKRYELNENGSTVLHTSWWWNTKILQWTWCFSLKKTQSLLVEMGIRRVASYELLWGDGWLSEIRWKAETLDVDGYDSKDTKKWGNW